mmetsp:Transcript_1759/g.3818  ORF Transcript_1759/g.3818 Transcript_1759/m.3818 type:complete len:200 (+) Transcript_1759:84-683(+)
MQNEARLRIAEKKPHAGKSVTLSSVPARLSALCRSIVGSGLFSYSDVGKDDARDSVVLSCFVLQLVELFLRARNHTGLQIHEFLEFVTSLLHSTTLLEVLLQRRSTVIGLLGADIGVRLCAGCRPVVVKDPADFETVLRILDEHIVDYLLDGLHLSILHPVLGHHRDHSIAAFYGLPARHLQKNFGSCGFPQNRTRPKK